MNRMKHFVDQVFAETIMNDDLREQKEELILNMTDKFNALVEEGILEQAAYEEVIDNFGSIEEIKKALNIEDNRVIVKKNINKKMIVISGMVIAVAIMTILATRYIHFRRFYMANDITKVKVLYNHITFNAKKANEGYEFSNITMQKISELQEAHSILTRDLNIFEKRAYNNANNQFFLTFEISNMYEKLSVRKRKGYWNELDEEVYNRFVKITSETMKLLDDEDFKISGYEGDSGHNDFKVLFARLDVEAISSAYQELNELANCYVRYNQLPEEMVPLTKDEVTEILKEKLNSDDITVTIQDYKMRNIKAFNCMYDSINVVNDEVFWYVSIEAFTGDILSLRARGKNEKTIIDEVVDEDYVKEVLHRLYDKEAVYRVVDKGINYKMSSHTEYYSYEVIPEYEGYTVYSRYESLLIYIDKSNLRVNAYSIEDIPSNKETIGEKEINYSESEALINVFDKELGYLKETYGQEIKVEDFNFVNTAFVKSFITGKFDLMHV